MNVRVRFVWDEVFLVCLGWEAKQCGQCLALGLEGHDRLSVEGSVLE